MERDPLDRSRGMPPLRGRIGRPATEVPRRRRRSIEWWVITALIPLGFAACASAPEGRGAERLSLSAEDAAREARTVVVSWADDAVLRYVEGEGVTPEGYVLRENGVWRFIYEAPGRADQLVVSITPRSVEEVTRPRQSPAGYALGDAALPDEWIDSPAALSAARRAGAESLVAAGEPAISMLLVPLRPAQWIIRIAADGQAGEWRIDARNGGVLGS